MKYYKEKDIINALNAVTICINKQCFKIPIEDVFYNLKNKELDISLVINEHQTTFK